MGEKGTLINDQVGGESIATRDAFEVDDDLNSRVIQRVDVSKGRLPATLSSMLVRTIVAADGYLLTSIPSEVSANAVDVGDKSTLVVMLDLANSSSTMTLICIPIVYASDGITIIGTLQPKNFVYDGTDSDRSTSSDAAGARTAGMQMWEVGGAAKIGICIPVQSDPYATVYGYAAVI